MMNRLLFICLICPIVQIMQAQSLKLHNSQIFETAMKLLNQDLENAKQEKECYIDLNLPSGTLWKSSNEEECYYTYDDAIRKFADKLPTQGQWEELWHSCLWICTNHGYKVVGNNGNFIYLPKESNFFVKDEILAKDTTFETFTYWTSTLSTPDRALSFTPFVGKFYSSHRGSFKHSVRLVHNMVQTQPARNNYDKLGLSHIIDEDLCDKASKQEYVDLGLPSGTLWRSSNERGGLYNYITAKKLFGDDLPRRGQWEELLERCTWTWTGNGYRVTGCNGNHIYLPSTGWRNYFGDGSISFVGSLGAYWTSVKFEKEYRAYGLNFDSEAADIGSDNCDSGRSVRLVKSK